MAILNYTASKSEYNEILLHLESCKDNFIPALDQTLDIPAYAKKIAQNAVTFEAWEENLLVGLVAAYLNDAEKYQGYITNVSVLPRFSGNGIASKLMKICMEEARVMGFKIMMLEVAVSNEAALKLYERNSFNKVKINGSTVLMKATL